jgi:hypothetical protein
VPNREDVVRLRKGVEAWNAWRRLHPDVVANLREARLDGVNLTDASLGKADLTEASLSRANLTRANLSRAFLVRADLTDANLTDTFLGSTDFSGANLCRTNLTRATLVCANFRSAFLKGTIFTDATLDRTIFAFTNLTSTVGLDSCTHLGPSVIDQFTLRLSRQLSPHFLRRCGLPDRLIDYLPSLVDGSPNQFYSCFISYSTADQAFADRLYADLQDRGVRCWFAPHDMQAGKKIHEQIDQAIRAHDRLLLILSDTSMTSPWVKHEIAKARAEEIAQKRRVLFPISLVSFDRVKMWQHFDADLGQDLAKEIRQYFVPDFSRWDNDTMYRPMFEKLVAGLKDGE